MKTHFCLGIFTLILLLQIVQGSLSIKSRQNPFYSVTYVQENNGTGQQKTERKDNKLVSTFSDPNFTKDKNSYRVENYAKSLYSGVRSIGNESNDGKSVNFTYIDSFEKLQNAKSQGQKIQSESVKKLVCYYSIPSFTDRPFAVFPESIDPFLCTHILIAFARFHNGSVVYNDPRDVEFYGRIVKLRERNADLKVMTSIGCTNDGQSSSSEEFSQMMSTKESRAQFIQKAIDFMNLNKLQGIDLDWEFPSWTGPITQKDQFTQLFIEFREIMTKTNESFLLTAAVGSQKPIIDQAYNISALALTLDFINLMTYDFHFFTWMSPFTGPNSPLFSDSDALGYLKIQNLAWSCNYWQENGMPQSKIVVGVPTYGHTFGLIDKMKNDYYSLADGFGTIGSGGFISYPEICQFMAENGSKVVFENQTRVPYVFKDKNWASFENEQSAREKANWVNTSNFGGLMVWNINSDDAYKTCNSSKSPFPIIQTLHDELFNTIKIKSTAES